MSRPPLLDRVTMKLRHVLPVALFITATVTLAGCAGTSSSPPDSVVVTRDVSSETGSDLALMTGLLVVENGCLRLESGVIPMFDEETVTWDGTTLHYLNADYVVGDEISLAGGSRNDSDRTGVPAECGDGSVFGVSRGADSIPAN
jgi:hypothetical protein